MIYTDDEFYSIMDDAMDSIPDDIFYRINNVSFEMQHEPLPQQKLLCSNEHFELLGLYEGIALPRRNEYSEVMRTPDRIWVFKNPIERLSADKARCRELIRTTLLHEIGHHFGLDDAQLLALGY